MGDRQVEEKKKKGRPKSWTEDEIGKFCKAVRDYGKDWEKVQQ